MDNYSKQKDIGTITALIERFETQTLPRALDIKEKVDKGELLSDEEITFLHEVYNRASQVIPFIKRHQEYEELFARAIHLYKEILNKALENERKK